MGVGVPDDGLTRPKSKYSSNVTMAKHRKRMESAKTGTNLKLIVVIWILSRLNSPPLVGMSVNSWSGEHILPQHWPWTNNFWKSSDNTKRSGDIVHLWTHRSWNKLQRVVNGNRSSNLQLKVLHWNLGARKWQQ